MVFPKSPFQDSQPAFLTGGFQADQPPSTSGTGSRQSRLPNHRFANTTRHLIHWLVPEQPMVQMYVNPEQMQITESKIIQPKQTKGGFIVQYWGENLGTINLTGTTGSSGIEGINVLRDIYRAEQLALDPYALFLASEADNARLAGDGAGITNFLGNGLTEALGGTIGGIAGSALGLNPGQQATVTRPRPSLAYLATSVEMYFSGEVYRGYFTNMTVTESVNKLGMFDYSIGFTFTQKRGFRQNFLSWHRSATNGPSNSDPFFGTPHSFNQFAQAGDRGGASTPQLEPAARDQDIGDAVESTLESFANIF